MGDGPALILVPSTLTEQWQVELWYRLGVPSARWWSTRKVWVDHMGHVIRTSGAADIVKCPYQVAVVSTGLIFHGWDGSAERWKGEAAALLEKRARPNEAAYGIVILDEAHRARGVVERGSDERVPNNLLRFMFGIASRARDVLLGTATPIQTDPLDLWDLVEVLAQEADHVLGTQMSPWRNDPGRALALVSGRERPREEADAWPWLANPLPPGSEHSFFDHARSDLGLRSNACSANSYSHTKLDDVITREELRDVLANGEDGLGFFKSTTPWCAMSSCAAESRWRKQG